jgi:hypothetical protein
MNDPIVLTLLVEALIVAGAAVASVVVLFAVSRRSHT